MRGFFPSQPENIGVFLRGAKIHKVLYDRTKLWVVRPENVVREEKVQMRQRGSVGRAEPLSKRRHLSRV